MKKIFQTSRWIKDSTAKHPDFCVLKKSSGLSEKVGELLKNL